MSSTGEASSTKPRIQQMSPEAERCPKRWGSWCIAIATLVLVVLGTLYSVFVKVPTTQPLSYWYPWRQRPPSVGFTFPRIFVWTPAENDSYPHVKDRVLLECAVFTGSRKHCYVTKDPVYHVVSDAIVMEASRMNPFDLPRSRHPEQVWVYSTLDGEPRERSWPLWRVSGMFNWTMSYRDDADIVVPYTKWRERAHNISLSRDDLLEAVDAKTKSVALFESECEEPLRHNYNGRYPYDRPRSSENFIPHVNQTIDIFTFSDCGRPLCNSLDECMKMASEDFYFVFVLETSPCFNHPMEMIAAAFKYNIVPVYFGQKALGDTVPQGSVFDTSQEATAFTIVDQLNVMRDDVDTYLSYFSWKETVERDPYPPLCTLCDALYASAPGSSASTDILAWWRRRPECDYVIPSSGKAIISSKLTPYGIYFVPDEEANIPGRIRRPPKVRRTTAATQKPPPAKEVKDYRGHHHDNIL